jgi:hypothetical protein
MTNQHRMVVDSKAIRDDFENYNDYAEEQKARYQLFYQMTRITRDRGSLAKDDRLSFMQFDACLKFASCVVRKGRRQRNPDQGSQV